MAGLVRLALAGAAGLTFASCNLCIECDRLDDGPDPAPVDDATLTLRTVTDVATHEVVCDGCERCESVSARPGQLLRVEVWPKVALAPDGTVAEALDHHR